MMWLAAYIYLATGAVLVRWWASFHEPPLRAPVSLWALVVVLWPFVLVAFLVLTWRVVRQHRKQGHE